MAMTTRGIRRKNEVYYRAATPPTTFYLMLFGDAVTPTVDTVLVSQLNEIPPGNGYTSGGIAIARNATDFDVLNEDTTLDRVLAQIKDITWTASGGTLPASGTGARWACLVDDNATVGNREVIHFWSLELNRIVSTGQPLSMVNLEIQEGQQT